MYLLLFQTISGIIRSCYTPPSLSWKQQCLHHNSTIVFFCSWICDDQRCPAYPLHFPPRRWTWGPRSPTMKCTLFRVAKTVFLANSGFVWGAPAISVIFVGFWIRVEIPPTSQRGPDELRAESAEKVLPEVLLGTRLGVPEKVPKNCRKRSRNAK